MDYQIPKMYCKGTVLLHSAERLKMKAKIRSHSVALTNIAYCVFESQACFHKNSRTTKASGFF